MHAWVRGDDSPSQMSTRTRKIPIRTRDGGRLRTARAHISAGEPVARTRRDPTQVRSRQTVAAIVEAAGRLLVEHGRQGVTTNAVADRAGVSIGSVYQYFNDREAIFAALQERHRKQVMPLIQHTLVRLGDPAVDIVDAVIGLVRAMAELHEHDPERLRAMSRELEEQTSPAEIESFAEATAEILAARFARSRKSIRPAAWLACMTLSHVGRALVHNPPAIEVDGLLVALARMLRGLFAELPQPGPGC